MKGDVKFFIDQPGVQESIYQSNKKLQSLERDVMERALSEVRAAFLQEFGFEGSFNLSFQWNKVGGKGAQYIPGGVRPVYKIRAADAATAATLKRHPGWLDKFSKGAKL